MKTLIRRSLSLLLALAVCLSLLTGISLTASADSYVSNWGTRGVDATWLSPDAEGFYAANSTSYSALSVLSGASNVDSVPSSPLYLQLQELMQSNHSFQSNFNETNDMYALTDCQANNDSYVSCLYCGQTLTSAWNSGVIWQREHTWPQSKSLNGGELLASSRTDETDIMMLRPACPNENQSRNNSAYGQSSGYFTPNKFMDADLDVRGDVARSVLYGYVRWGNTANMWGTDGVIESVDVLLAWMEADPVDTWEMGRNDAVQSITGTRNVFIDFPELVFLLFGQEVPESYTSPSDGAEHTYCTHGSTTQANVIAAGCTQSGYSGETVCTACSTVVATGDTVAAAGHSYVNGNCVSCGLREATGGGTDYTLVTAATAQAGNYVIGAVRGESYPTIYPATGKLYGTSDVDWYVSETKMEVQNDTLSSADLPSDAQIVTLTGDNETGFTVGFMSEGVMKYVGYTDTKTSRRLALGEEYSTTLWKVVDDPDGGVALISEQGNYSICQNSVTTAAIRGYFDAKMFTGIYLFWEVQANPVASVNGVEYTAFQDAYAASGEGQHIQLLDNIYLDSLEMTKDLYIDLNGKTMEAVVDSGEYTVYGIDTATDQYVASNGWLCLLDQDGSILTPQIHVQADSKRYMAIENDSGWSFHRYYVGITTVVLSTHTTGIGYKAVFYGTDQVVAQLADTQAFSYSLRLEGGGTVTRSLDTVTSGQVVSLRVNNFDVANYSETALYAKVSITLGDTVIESAEHSITMRQLVETVNENYTNYPTQLDALAAFVEKYYDTMSTWQVENLYKPE